MDSTAPAPNHHEPVPVNRFALFSETLLAGVLVLSMTLIFCLVCPSALEALGGHAFNNVPLEHQEEDQHRQQGQD